MMNKMLVQLGMWCRSLNRVRLAAGKNGVFAKSRQKRNQVATAVRNIQAMQWCVENSEYLGISTDLFYAANV